MDIHVYLIYIDPVRDRFLESDAVYSTCQTMNMVTIRFKDTYFSVFHSTDLFSSG